MKNLKYRLMDLWESIVGCVAIKLSGELVGMHTDIGKHGLVLLC